MLVLHHLEQSRSQRIVWLLEELGVEYVIKTYARVNMLAPAELKQVHARGKSPVITDGDLTIAESGVIVEYLIEKYGNGRFVTPAGDQQKQLDDRYFQHFAEGSLMPYLVMKLLFINMQARSPFFIRPIAGLLANGVDSAFIMPNIKSCMQLVSDTLTKDGGRQWIAGGSEPTGADFMMSFPLEAAYYGGRADDLPQSIKEYVERVQARPAYQRGLAKTPGYNYAPKPAKL